MGIWSGLKRGLGTTDESTRPAYPTFEHLEPRLLLSADPAGLAVQISADFLDNQDAAEAAIVVDFEAAAGEAVASGEGSQIADHGERQTENSWTVGQSDSLTVQQSDRLLVSQIEAAANLSILQQNDIQSSPADASEGSPLFHTSPFTLETSVLGPTQNRGPPTEIVFIDSSLNRYFQLENAVSPGVVVSVFDASADGIQHITDVLSSYSSLSAIHIVSHGAAGLATLGAARLSSDTLEFYTDRIRNWGAALAADADILFYGCNLAAGQVGQALVTRIADLTGADVAASEDPTGASDLGGDWDLEFQTGSIETSPIPSGFGGLLTLDTPGDVAFIGYNADGNDDFAIVALDDVDPNTVVYFTDNEWLGSSFNTGEGSFGWDSGAATIAAGTVITFSSTSSGSTPNIGSLTGEGTGSINLNVADEGLWAYLGTDIVTPTTFLAAIFNDFAGSGNVLTNSNLVTGSSAVAITGDEDIMVYNGPRSGEAAFSSYLSLIGDAANWITQDGTGDQSNDTIAPDLPFDTTALTITDSTISLVAGDLVIQDTNGGDTDDTLTLSTDGTAIVISDPSQTLGITGLTMATGQGTHSVTVPLTEPGFSGGIIVNTLAGNDSLTIDFGTGNFSKAITYNGGDPTSGSGDSLTLQGGETFTNATFGFINANDGTIDITGNATITYTGWSPSVRRSQPRTWS